VTVLANTIVAMIASAMKRIATTLGNVKNANVAMIVAATAMTAIAKMIAA